jgi:ATP-dependent DNA helicase PIF1
LSDDQEEAVCAVRECEYVAIFGAAGTGKSLVRDVISARTRSIVLGPTGMSIASVRNGKTISRFLGGTGSASQLAERFGASGEACRGSTIVIDEVSMVSTDDFVGLDNGLRIALGERDRPFGGLRVVLIGDVYQLEPPDGGGYFFETATFGEMKERGLRVVQLVTQHRQMTGDGSSEDDMMLGKILADARRGQFGTFGANLLAYVGMRNAPSCVMRIVSRRADAAVHNNRRLGMIEGRTFVCGNGTSIKVGARVVFTQNYYGGRLRRDGPLLAANGVVGVVVGLPSPGGLGGPGGESRVLVEVCGRGIVAVEERRLRGKESHPLGLAWALTIHKTQGQTFSEGIVVDGTHVSEAGQAYVAISRVRRLEDLWVTNLLPEDFEIERKLGWKKFVDEHGLQ